jgi:hypothetical protein
MARRCIEARCHSPTRRARPTDGRQQAGLSGITPILGIKMRKQVTTTADRMRLYRARRRNGLRCIQILLHDTEIDALIRKGFLKPDRRAHERAVERAIGAFVCAELGPVED